GRTWSPRATITAREASFEDAEKFPYRLANASGQILVNGGTATQPPPSTPAGGLTLDLNLRGDADGAPVLITGAFHDIELRNRGNKPRPPMPMGWVEVAGNGIPISQRLVAAIPEDEARDFVTSLHPTGKVDVQWRAERNDPTVRLPRLALKMRLNRCRMLYDKFPYPLDNVTGWVEQRDKNWKFYELRARDTQGRTLVAGAGTLEPRDGTCRFDLRLQGEATALNQTLYDALPSDAQQAWAFLRPRGQIDFVADITRECGQREPAVRLAMTPHQRNLAIEPPLSAGGYRYRLERVDGNFDWAADRLVIKNARAEHGRTQYTSDGTFERRNNGSWKLDLQGLNADRLSFDRDFLLAAPPELREVIEDLQPTGAFELFDSRLEVIQNAGPSGTVGARWRIGLDCHQASLNPGVPLDGMSGVIRLSGQSDGTAAATAGELDLDSLFWNDLQLTNVRGPLWADGNDCFLGEGATRKVQGTESRSIEANAYGGAVRINSWVRHGGQARYGLALSVGGVDVTRLSAEWLQRPEALDGSLDGQLELQGVGSSVYGMTGRGAFAVSDADLYELPLFLSLLKYLRNRAPDTTAFNRLETKFTLEGEDLTFENFDLLGDAVSLYGKGTATLQRDVDLTFASIVGRNEFSVPILNSLVRSASEQLLRLRVVGPADNPEVRREVLPMAGNVFEQLQSEFGNRLTAGAPQPTAPTRR
ncbi:MAG: AsmA-like C-terminal region-containing protein, partial [Planctomycetota bacterium]